MKILIIQPGADKRGHFGVYTVNACQELARLGHFVILITNKVYPKKFIIEKPLFEIIEWQEGKYNFAKFDQIKTKNPLYYIFGYLRNSFFILRYGLKFARGKQFDVVQIFDTEYSIVSLLIRLYGYGLKICLLINAPNFSFKDYNGSFFIKIYKEFQKRFLRPLFWKQIQGIVTLGEFHKKELQRQFNLKENFPIAIIYDGAKMPEKHLNRTTARSKIGISYSGPLLLFFGMIRKDKGIEYLFEAVSLLKNENFKLLFAGSLFDYNENDILKMIDNFKIMDKVITKFDYIPDSDVYNYFFASDALILPYISLYRGGSGPLLKEAAVCKVPAIVSDVSEMGPLVRKYKMGLVVEPENPESLSKAIKTFLHSSNEARQKMGESAFRATNTWSSMAKKYEEFYKSISLNAH
ncbi:MAG TPA: glycosyltransferase family 4 protein [Candidatus Paceibacterota bacterium]|nr:glycosyltransferase family 4 protein [Candidatus Paceibacterota bacterium]